MKFVTIGASLAAIAFAAIAMPASAQQTALPTFSELKPWDPAYKAPRTSFGKPELDGVWTNASVTRMDRPNGLPLVINEEQAAQAKAVFETLIKDFRLVFTLNDPTHLEMQVEGTPVGGSVAAQASTSSVVLVKGD